MTATTDTTATAASFADDLHRLADMVDADATVADGVERQLGGCSRLLIPVMHTDDPVGVMRDWIHAGLAAGCEIVKSFEDAYANVDLIFPAGLTVHVYANREQVCDRVVTGTREVTEEVRDPEALKAVPTVTVTKTVEDVEWICRPLLAEIPS